MYAGTVGFTSNQHLERGGGGGRGEGSPINPFQRIVLVLA